MSNPFDSVESATGNEPARPGPSDSQAGRGAAQGEAAGDTIDRYKLLEKIGEGGMGSVWMAQQSEPVERRVALKIIKLGMDTREVVARFEVERQALALMDHPHIAKVFDAGATDSGRPYFVMELVRGVPITTYCDLAKLELRERLELFSRVCHAIQHAHQKGVIHRDVKPSNILVAMHEDAPVPKVIDFGIAKATSTALTQKTLYTKYGQIVGTPEHMAPEQADMTGFDIDTRADVYSLGVLLYELLTGTKPIDIQQALASGYEELLRTIREDDPAKPSTRISSLGEYASSIAVKRQVDAALLCKRLRGDLDWIVMKALEKDRRRRYDTANEFAADITNYLDHLPVHAAPPSTAYRLRKLLRRRMKTVIITASICVLLMAGSVGTGFGLWKTKQANRALDIALGEKASALKQEEEQRALAERNAQRARASEFEARARADDLEHVAAFLAEQHSGIDIEGMGIRLRAEFLEAAPADQRADWAEKVGSLNFTSLALGSLRDNLFNRTVHSIDRQFVDQPLVRGKLLQSTTETFRELGLLEMSQDPQRRALALMRKHLGADHSDTLHSIESMGQLLQAQGQLVEAEPYFHEALEGNRRVNGDEHVETLVSFNNMGALLAARGEHSGAESYYQMALEGRRRVLGDDSPDTLVSINNMGALFQSQGKYAEAELYLREALEGNQRALGSDDPNTLGSIASIGALFMQQGKHTEAEPFFRQALEGCRRVRGDDHPDTLVAVNNLGILLKAQGLLAESEPYLREALRGCRLVLGNAHPNTLGSLNNLGLLLQARGEFSEAEPYFLEALEGLRRSLGNTHANTLTTITNMGLLLQDQGRLWEAETYFREALELRLVVLEEGHPQRLDSVNKLKFLLRRIVKSERDSGSGLGLGKALLSQGSFQLGQGLFSAAERTLTEALDILFAEAPEGSASPWRAQADLGAAIAGQGRYAEVESMLLESANWLLENGATAAKAYSQSDVVPVVLQHVVELYQALHVSIPGKGYGAKATSWQARLDAWTAAQLAGGEK